MQLHLEIIKKKNLFAQECHQRNLLPTYNKLVNMCNKIIEYLNYLNK